MLKKLSKFLLFALWRQLHRNHVLIFSAHGVVDYGAPAKWRPLRRQLDVKNLERGLMALSKYFRFISLDQACSILTNREKKSSYCAVLTFDDGYENNVSHALPVMQRLGVPATFFLATGHIERREPFWYDRLDYAIQHLRSEQAVNFLRKNFLFSPDHTDQLCSTFSALRQAVKEDNRHYSETMANVRSIAEALEKNADCRLSDVFEGDHFTAVMNWESARHAAKQGVAIGSHTVDHVLLDHLDIDSARAQLLDSKKMIESQLDTPCHHLCYPNGNWSEHVVALAREAGFKSAVTTKHGFARQGDNLLTLHRMNFLDTSDPLSLLLRASGFPHF